LWVQKGGEITLTDLETANYAGYHFARGMKKMGVDGILRRTAVGDSVDLIAAMVASGHYVGFLPDHYVETMPIGADLRPILTDDFSYSVEVAVVHRSGNHSRMVSGFLQSLFPEGGAFAAG